MSGFDRQGSRYDQTTGGYAGVYVESHNGKLRFRQIAPPATEELQVLLHRVAHRVARYLEQRGLLERDVENSYLSLEGLEEDTDAMSDLYGHSITYRDGTTHVIFDGAAIRPWISWPGWQPWSCAARPRPRVNLTRYHGVFAPNSAWRAEITPGRRGSRRRRLQRDESGDLY